MPETLCVSDMKLRILIIDDEANIRRTLGCCYTVGLDLVKRQFEKEAGADREKPWQAFERLQTPHRPLSDLR